MDTSLRACHHNLNIKGYLGYLGYLGSGVFGVSVKFTFEDWSRGVASGVAVAGRTFCIDSYSIGPISVKEPQG
jgi:hypothetical protein